MMRKSIAFVLALLAIPLASYAETTPLTLATAVERAQSASFAVRLSESDASAANARALGAKSQLLPQIGLSGTTMRGGIAQLGMPTAQQTYVLATASVPLVLPAQIASATAASRSADASAFDVLSARNDAAFLATQAYERALLAIAIVASRQSTLAYQERRVRDVAVRVRAGAAPRYQSAQAQAARAESARMLEDARADRDEAVTDLETLLDLPLSPALQFADVLTPIALATDVAALERKAKVQRPEVLSAGEQVRAAFARIAAARDAYLPNIAAAAQTYAGHSSPDLGPRGYSVGITATIPLLDGGTRTAEYDEAKAEVQRSQILLEQAQRSAERDVANAYREYEASRNDFELARTEAVATAEELRIATLRERNGKGIPLETLAAIADDATARENLLRAIARVNDAAAGVYHAAGDTLPNQNNRKEN